MKKILLLLMLCTASYGFAQNRKMEITCVVHITIDYGDLDRLLPLRLQKEHLNTTKSVKRKPHLRKIDFLSMQGWKLVSVLYRPGENDPYYYMTKQIEMTEAEYAEVQEKMKEFTYNSANDE